MGIFDIKPSRNEDSNTPDKTQDAEKTIEEQIVAAIQEVYDPEIPVNVYDMGLIYKVNVDPGSTHCDVDMTLTTPNCPAAQYLPVDVQRAVEGVSGIESCQVQIVWEPTWGPEMMSETAKMELGIY